MGRIRTWSGYNLLLHYTKIKPWKKVTLVPRYKTKYSSVENMVRNWRYVPKKIGYKVVAVNYYLFVDEHIRI